MSREYFAIRKGFIKKDEALNFDMFKKAFLLKYRDLEGKGFFQKHIGLFCTDGFQFGTFGHDLDTAFFLKAGTTALWPVYEKINLYSEIDLFTIIEILHDASSYPTKTWYHQWNDCGFHVEESNDEKGKVEFRKEINPILKRYKGLEITENGEILQTIESGFEPLFEASIPTTDEDNITAVVNSAILKFRRASSTVDDRRDALRDLAGVLEYLKKPISKLPMSEDVKDLGNIANNFAIRHHNKNQKTEYDKAIWHSWIFYAYLSTIHVAVRLIEQNKSANSDEK